MLYFFCLNDNLKNKHINYLLSSTNTAFGFENSKCLNCCLATCAATSEKKILSNKAYQNEIFNHLKICQSFLKTYNLE